MSAYGRSIKVAFDKLSGEILDADDIFEVTKDAFKVRKQFHMDEVELYCCECLQKLNVSTSKYDRLHFKHNPNAEFCILKDENLSPEEKETFNNIYKAKESDRHHELKNKIGNSLRNIEGIDISTIAIDSKFIIRGSEKRRPDVYCKYGEKELVFEIQLSDLSLRYILSRYLFYKKHGIYLIWILDNFDIQNQRQLERDIKYLANFENFFKLDETSPTFKLDCQYKYPFSTSENKLLTKWLQKSVSLSQIKFDCEEYQIYYYDLHKGKTLVENAQQKKILEIQEQERKKIEDDLLDEANWKAKNIIAKIKAHRERKAFIYSEVTNLINDLSPFELEILNKMLKLSERKKPAVIEWVENATNDDIVFIEFIIKCEGINININDATQEGITVFQAIYQNENLHKYLLSKSILERGYKLTEADLKMITALGSNNAERAEEAIKFTILNRVYDRTLIGDVYRFDKLVYILETARRKKITGFNYKADQWIAFANNAVLHHNEYWEYIEAAFKYYGLWDIIVAHDAKMSFQSKVNTLYQNMPQQKFDFEMLYNELYPEVAF